MVKRTSTFHVAAIGCAIIAITYGLARFLFGLFLPVIRDDLGLNATAAGLIGSLPFISFIGAILVGPALSEKMGPRVAGGLAVGLASAGLLSVANASGVVALSIGIAICGVSTGVSSPAMAQAVDRIVASGLRGRVNAIHNAGTSLGVASAMPAMAWLLGDWRLAYMSFGILAALVTVSALLFLPRRQLTEPPSGAPHKPPAISQHQWKGIGRLAALAGGMGLVSSIFWVFAPDLVVREGGLSSGDAGWMWLAVGLAGLVVGAAGDLIDRKGPGRTHSMAMLLMALSLGMAAAAPNALFVALVSASLFGASYMILTGFYLVQSIRVVPERPALGPVLPLIATAAGQAAGSPLSGWVIGNTGYLAAFTGFALIGLTLAVTSYFVPKD